jgi:hypothetical protein
MVRVRQIKFWDLGSRPPEFIFDSGIEKTLSEFREALGRLFSLNSKVEEADEADFS